MSTAVLAYFARHVVYDIVVLPIAYLLWQLRGLLSGVAQLVQWGILVVVMALVMAWQLVPRLAARGRRKAGRQVRDGPVNGTAAILWRARTSSYFRWQLAHRLGRVANQLGDLPGSQLSAGGLSEAIATYLDAGVNHSFVEYASPRLSFPRPAESPLDLAPEDVVQYLESHLMPGGDPHAHGR